MLLVPKLPAQSDNGLHYQVSDDRLALLASHSYAPLT